MEEEEGERRTERDSLFFPDGLADFLEFLSPFLVLNRCCHQGCETRNSSPAESESD